MVILEPTDIQQKQLDQLTGAITTATFVAAHDTDALSTYLQASQAAVANAHGKRLFTLTIDQVLAGQPIPFTHLIIDQFPNQATVRQTHDALTAERTNTLSELHALLIRPVKSAAYITKFLRYLQPIFHKLAHIDKQKTINPAKVLTPPTINATPAQFEQLQTHDQSTPFYNLNLTKCYNRAADLQQITKHIYQPSLLKIAGLGGYVAVTGDVLGTWIGAETQSLYDQWEEFNLAFWPSRRIFQIYLANVNDEVVESRQKYFARAVQLPCSKVT